MGRAREVRFNVTINSTVGGMGESRDFSLTSALLPERVTGADLLHTGLTLVQVVRKNGPGGLAVGVYNWRQVKGSAAYFDEKLVRDVNTILEDLMKHGACAAFVRVQPTVAVSIPVFVLDDVQLNQMMKLKDKGTCTKVSLAQSHSSHFDSKENEGTADSFVREDERSIDQKSKEVEKTLSYADAASTRSYEENATVKAVKVEGSSVARLWNKGVKKMKQIIFIYEPKVKADLKSILFQGCDWFPSGGNLHSFRTAMNLVAIAEASDEVDAELNEIYTQLDGHMKKCNHQVDVVLFSFAASFLRLLKGREPNKERKGLRTSIEKCCDSFTVRLENPSLIRVIESQMQDTSTLNPCQPLLYFTTTYLKKLKTERSRERDGLFVKLLWVQVHHCGKSTPWEKLIYDFEPSSFRPLSPSLCLMYSFVDSMSFHSLGLFMQSSLEDSCDFIEEMCERTGSNAGEMSVIKVDPIASKKLTDTWIRKICSRGKIQNELCSRFLRNLNSLSFAQNNEQWKTEVFTSFVGCFCARDLLRLDFLLKCIKIEHTYYNTCREVIVKKLQSELSSYNYWDTHIHTLKFSVVECLLKTDIGSLFGTSKLFPSVKVYVLQQIKKAQEGIEVKVRILGALYEKLVRVGEVEYDDIQSFVINALDKAMDPTYVSRNSKTVPEIIFHVASDQRKIFASGPGPLLEKVAQLVIKQIAENANFATNPKCLLNLPLDHSGDETLISCLTVQLTSLLRTHLNGIEEATAIYCNVKSKGASPDLIRVLDTVLQSAIESWSPSGVFEIFQLSCLHLINSLCIDQNNEVIRSKFEGLKHMFANWTRTSQVGANNLLLRDIGEVHNLYEPSRWQSIESLTGENLVDDFALGDILRQFDEVTSTININFHSGSQSLLDIVRRYECNTDDEVGAARLLTDCKMIIDPSNRKDVMERHSISSIQTLSAELISFRQEFGSQIETAAYFLRANCQLFSKSIGFGDWDCIQIEDFIEKVSSAGTSLQSLVKCENSGILSATGRAVVMCAKQDDLNILDFDAVKNEISLLVACPTFGLNDSHRDRFFLLSSLISITKPLRAFIECCKQLKFQFTFEDKCFGELEDVVGKLEWGEDSQLYFQFYHDLAQKLVQIVSTSTEEKKEIELLVRTLDESALFMTIFRTIARTSDVWVFVREMKWFGKEGLQQFYAEFSNTTNKLLFASFESSVLDSLEPTVRFLSHVGSLHAESNVGNFVCNLMENFKYDFDSRKQRMEVLQVVQQNITNIREWFEGGFDDMAAIFSRFDSVWESGKYIIENSELCLVYLHDDRKEVHLSGSKLAEFAQQLGFVQHENEGISMQITSFLDQLQILRKVVTSHIRVISEGYRRHELKKFEHSVNQELTAATEILRGSTKLLKECETWRCGLRKKYPLSTLFSDSDLRGLYDAITADEKDLNVIIPTLSVIIPPKNLASLHDTVQSITKVCLNLMDNVSLHTKETWIETVSQFLVTFHVQMNSVRYSYNAKPREHGIILHLLDCEEEKKELLCLSVISHVYSDRLPECFELLDGFCTPSLAELNLFLDRVAAFPNLTFMLTNVQALPGNYQEAIVNFTSRPNATSEACNLHCVQLSETILHSSPWVEEIVWDDKKLKEAAPDSWKTCVVDGVNIRTVRVVASSSSGAGKTRFIHEKMGKLKRKDPDLNIVTINIHEGTTLDSLVRSLRGHQSHEATQNAVHFSFSLPMDKCDSKLIKSLNHFFNHLLLSRSVRSPTSGETFIMGWSRWYIYIEIPSIGVETNLELKATELLRRNLPILSLCATVQVPPKQFDIEDKARRVSTYLRAFSDGTIDRKFDRNANKQLIFVIDDSGSMGLTLDDGRSPFEIAIANALNMFDTHLQVGDSFGTIIFNSTSRVQVQFQEVQDDAHKQYLRGELGSTPFIGGGTEMYDALNRAMEELQRGGDSQCKSWIVCLTDGESNATGFEELRQSLSRSSPKLSLMVVGVNLKTNYENHLRDLCSKFGNADTQGTFIPSQASADAMNNAFDQVAARIPVSETFELDGLLSDQDCWRLMKDYLPEFVQSDDMLRRKFWIEFLYRRVKVFDDNEDFNYNESHDALGSSLMKVMLYEARQLLSENHNTNWKKSNHEQLIYDFTDPFRPQFRLICTAPDLMANESIDRYESLDLPGFCIPTSTQLRQRTTLDRFLSQALNVPLVRGPNGSERISCIDDNKFVLTLDFVMKLLNIHERVACHIPCVIEGETGVSKTALTKMYSILRNSSLNERARVDTEDALDDTAEALGASDLLNNDVSEKSFEAIQNGLIDSADGTRSSKTEIAREVHRLLLRHCEKRSSIFQDVPEDFKAEITGESNVVLELLNWFRESTQEQTFFELNVDASLNETQIKAFFDQVSRTARKVASSGALVIVFLDEVNTSSIIGLFKEVVSDHSICGKTIEDNIVVVAACNPAGRKSLSSNASRECDLAKEWASGHYQVNELPSSISCVKWQYGSLDAGQEKEFVLRRMEMDDSNIPKYLLTELTELVVCSQEAIRSFAADEIEKGLKRSSKDACRGLREEAETRARSAVSLRDIQRVFSLYHFFTTEFPLTAGEDHEHYRNSMYLTIAIVYYLKLDFDSRRRFIDTITSNIATANDFLDILDGIMTKIALDTEIPDSIALTDGLKENIFMTLVCALSFTPLVIVGPPGSSKTLAVNIVDANANGEESPSLLYHELSRLTTYHYQCSKTSTSNEVSSVFETAIRRQKALDPTEHKCLVFMDEAGLPEEEKESLKVLHYYLEGHMSTAKVGFVAITNHVLDAAKSNRCVSLLRQDPSEKEMLQIAEGVLYNRVQGAKLVNFGGKKLKMETFASKLCTAYKAIISLKDFDTFYGLRDFIYFLKSVKQRSEYAEQTIKVTLENVIRALERNFNGVHTHDFERLVQTFLQKCFHAVPPNLRDLLRSPLDVVREALSTVNASETRYTLIVDECRDDSILRILNNEGLLELSKKTLFKFSNLAENSHLERLTLVSGVKFAAAQGSKVVLSQTDSVNESFYDLFNQHFRRIRNRDGNEQLYANIAVGGISRRSPVSSTFQCVLHVNAAELPLLPAPFLNRFEKFRLSPETVLSSKLEVEEPSFMKRILVGSRKQIDTFTSVLKLCSFAPAQTTESCFLEILSDTANDTFFLSDEKFSEAKTFADYFIAFAAAHLHCDLSMTDFDSITEYGLKYFPLSESEALSELLEKTEITYAKEAFEECICRQPSTMVSILVERLSESVITRLLIFKLLQLATPEEIFTKRHVLPVHIVTEYFQQHHFGIKPLLQSMRSQSENRAKRYIVHTRSDVDILRIPTLRVDERCAEKLQKIQKYVQDDAETMIIEHLTMLKNESSLRTAIESWSTSSCICTFLLFVDMGNQAAFEMVNFARCCIDQLQTNSNKRFVMILHYPPPAFLSNSFYPSLFLGGWHHVYLNSIFQSTDLKHVIKKACIGFQDHHDLQIQEMTDEIMTDVMKSLASHEIFYSGQISSNSTFHQRHELLSSILSCSINNSSSIRTILCTKFSEELWTEKNLTMMLRRASWSLKKGTSQLGLTRCLQSIMKDAMRNFCQHYLLQLNEWRNLDLLLLDPSPGESIEALFHNILVQIPGLPFAELILHQVDLSQKLREIPSTPGLEVTFPFFLMISTLLDEVVECTLMKYDTQSDSILSLNVLTIFHDAMTLLRKNAADEKYSDITLKTVETVLSQMPNATEKSLFEHYLEQFLTWKLCCTPGSLAARWFIDKLDQDEANTMKKNLLWIHIAAKKFEMSLIRLTSTSAGLFWGDLMTNLQRSRVKSTTPDSDLPLRGFEVVRSLCSWFGNSIPELIIEESAKGWTENFSMFFGRLSDIGNQNVVCERTSLLLRLSVFFYVLKENTRQNSTCLDCISAFYDKKSLRQNCNTSIPYFVELIKRSKEDDGCKRMWMKEFLNTLFSPQMLSNTDLHWESDLRFVMTDFQLLDIENTDDLTLTLLRNACIYGAIGETMKSDNEPVRDRKATLLSTSRLAVVNNLLRCHDLSIFSEEGDRLSIPHFIPNFAQANHSGNPRECMPRQQIPEIDTFFSDYTDKFPSRIVAEAVFQIILEDTIHKLVGKSSEQTLTIFLKSVEMESKLSRQEQTRLRRVQSNGENINYVGSPLGILIVESYLVCFIFKISFELARGEPVTALEGVYADSGWSVLNCAMSTKNTRLQEIFMKNVIRLGGQGKLFDLLRKGGLLNGLNWTKEWSGGLPEARGEIEVALDLAETELRDAMQEEERKTREMRLCPHCDQPFQILERNCGQFICGRAATDEIPINGVNGCGGTFRDSQAPYYQRNETLLVPLRKAVAEARQNAQAYDEMSRFWNRLVQAKSPYLSSQLDGHISTSFYPVSIAVNTIGNDSEIFRHLVYSQAKIEHFLMLPDLIELYIWLHSTFKFIISAQQATSLTLGEVMDEMVLLKRFDRTHSDHILNLYERAKTSLSLHLKNCNNEVNWDCETVSVPFQNLDETPLIMLLSAYDHPTDGYDFLFVIINQLILQFNEFIFKLHGLQGIEAITPKSLLHRSPAGLALKTLKFLSSVEFPLIVESYRTPNEDEYNVKALEEYIVEKLSACNFSIENPLKNLRSKFQFRTDIDVQASDHQTMVGIKSSTGVYFVHQQDIHLFENCANQVNCTSSQELEPTFITKFHSLEYEQLRSMLEGIRNSLQTEGARNSNYDTFQDLLLASIGSQNEMEEIGFPSLTKSQLDLILSLKPSQVCELIYFLGYQLASESYNFATLPLSMKSKMHDEIKQDLRKNLSSLADEVGMERALHLLHEFKNDILSFYQTVIKDQCFHSNDKLKAFLEDKNFCDDSDLIFTNLPDQITVRNYVSLCQELHQQTLFFMSSDRQLDFAEDELIDTTTNSSYTNPRRGSCWLFNSKSDPEESQPGDCIDSDDGNSVVENTLNISDPHGGLWFGVAQRAHEAYDAVSDDDSLSQSNEIPNDYEFVQAESTPSLHSWSESPNSSDEHVMIGGCPVDQYLEHFAANIIQSWWRSLQRKQSSTIRSARSAIEPQMEDIDIRIAPVHSQSFVNPSVVSQHNKENEEEERERKRGLARGGNIDPMSAIQLFLVFFAAHVAFRLLESMYTE